MKAGTLVKGLDLLTILSVKSSDSSLAELANAIEIDKSAAHRILAMMHSVRPSAANLYNVNLGQYTPVALGLALGLPNRRVVALDGDGNLLMNMASRADAAHHKPNNLKIIVFDSV